MVVAGVWILLPLARGRQENTPLALRAEFVSARVYSDWLNRRSEVVCLESLLMTVENRGIAALEMLAKSHNPKRSQVSLVSGPNSPQKRVLITGLLASILGDRLRDFAFCFNELSWKIPHAVT